MSDVKNKVKSTKIEIENRIRAVQEWILLGYATSDIIRQITISYKDVGQRQAYKYYNKAFELWKEENKKSVEAKKAYHIALRRKLFKDLKEKDTPTGTKTALSLADSIAKIDGTLIGEKEKLDDFGEKEIKINTIILPTEQQIEL